MTATSVSRSRSAQDRLTAFYNRNGSVRLMVQQRRATQGNRYKKGDEVRLVALSSTELAAITRLLDRVGFVHGKPFTKGCRFVVPIYGRDQVARFLKMVS